MRKFLLLSGFLSIVLLFICCSGKETPSPVAPPTGNPPAPNGKSSAKEILETPQIVGLKDYTSNFDNKSLTYAYEVAGEVGLKALKLTVKISPGASISPNPVTERDYSVPVVYTVTAEDGSKQSYTVKISQRANPLPQGKTCLVSRIENVETKEYYEFKYDSGGKVTTVIKGVLYRPPYIEPWERLTCLYGESGLLAEIKREYITNFYSGEETLYRFVYGNGKLDYVATKGRTGIYNEGVEVNNNHQVVAFKRRNTSNNTYTCYNYTYEKWTLSKLSFCETGTLLQTMAPSDTRHYISGQAQNPGFLFVLSDFMDSGDPTGYFGLCFGYYGIKNINNFNYSRHSGEFTGITYTTNESNFPTLIEITHELNAYTSFPTQKKYRYKVTYSNCN